MRIELPDGSSKELDDGASGADLAAAIGPGLARAALAVKVDGSLRDLERPLAAAVLDLYPGTRISIGPPIEDGFYYDFEFPDGVTVSEHDLPALEERMREHVKARERFTREDVSAGAAIERFLAEDQPYKVELIEDLVRDEGVHTVSLYTNDGFTDLCRGPHAPDTGRIKAFKLLSLAGAYWRGDAKRQMLTRIYGTAFHSKAQLERLEQARARDHRRLGRELGLFTFSDVSPGVAFWLPAGTTLFNELVALNRSMQAERGYVEVKTPLVYESQLWETSGHWGKYRENIFVASYEDRDFGFKPMNCPGHCELFSLQRWSYRELPFRCAEPGLLHRREPSGTLHGLLRVRHFIQDDAHIFCTEEQVQDEVAACLDFAFDVYRLFDFPVHVELSTRPDDRLGDDALWDRMEATLAEALRSQGIEYTVAEGEGAFYAPKIDLHMTDSLGRSWQLGTVQLDSNLPERFQLTYTGADNAEHRPVMIHRALFGSFERFIGILLEHYAGELPLWLAPLQALVLPVSDRHLDYAARVADRLGAEGLRARVDDRGESIGRKIRDAELRKVPYMLVVGDREAQSDSAALRRHREGDLGTLGVDEIAARLLAEVAERRAAA